MMLRCSLLLISHGFIFAEFELTGGRQHQFSIFGCPENSDYFILEERHKLKVKSREFSAVSHMECNI